MLSKPLNNGDFYETHVAYWLVLIHSIAVQADRAQRYSRKRTTPL